MSLCSVSNFIHRHCEVFDIMKIEVLLYVLLPCANDKNVEKKMTAFYYISVTLRETWSKKTHGTTSPGIMSNKAKTDTGEQ